MNLNFTLTFADFRSAFRLHRRQKFFRRFSIVIWPCVTFVCFAVALASNPKSELFAQGFAIGVGSLWISICWPFARMLSVRRSYARAFPKAQANHDCFASVDDESVVAGVVGINELKYAWKGVYGFAQDEKITLFYTSKCSFLFFRTDSMTSEQRQELNDLVKRHIVKR